MKTDKIISLTNLFQHLLSAEIYLNEKLILYYPIYWEISKSMQGTNKQQRAFFYYASYHLEYGG